jgi:hypothetical protein
MGCGGALILVGLFSDDDADENQRKQFTVGTSIIALTFSTLNP